MVEELRSYTQSDIKDLDLMMHVLSETSFITEARLMNAINDDNTHIYIIRDEGHIIWTATLCLIHTLEFTLAHVESVVVLPAYRGRKVGKELMEFIIWKSKRMYVKFIQLTSNPKRESTNNLYKKLGFNQYETNCYKLTM